MQISTKNSGKANFASTVALAGAQFSGNQLSQTLFVSSKVDMFERYIAQQAKGLNTAKRNDE